MGAKLNAPPYRTAYRVMRTTGSSATEACRHRHEWIAEWCARRGTRRSGVGVFYVVLPAVTS